MTLFIISDSFRRTTLFVLPLLLVLAFTFVSQTVEAANETRAILKTYFETGDIPTEGQFGNLIDSMVHLADPGLTYSGAVFNVQFQGALLDEGSEIGPGNSFLPVPGLGEEWIGNSGFLGLSLELNSQTHYGYLQITSPPGDEYPMFVEYFVYETDPNTAIVTTAIPEPCSFAMTFMALCSLVISRRCN